MLPKDKFQKVHDNFSEAKSDAKQCHAGLIRGTFDAVRYPVRYQNQRTGVLHPLHLLKSRSLAGEAGLCGGSALCSVTPGDSWILDNEVQQLAAGLVCRVGQSNIVYAWLELGFFGDTL